jgi:L-threonylcarbamoyladenylate synthase
VSGTTRILSTGRDDPDLGVIEEAAEVLRSGGLVAFATETVYGLGADATNPEAVARIFEAKGRPATNPLIVHVDGVAMARECLSDFTESDEYVVNQWWPGPVTFVFYRSTLIPDIITAGGPTVGVRVPRPPVARALIHALGRPIAAPSANRSRSISPTRAEHVLKDLDGRIDLILDSGPTEVGLESTVVDMTRWYPRILRPGPVHWRDLVAKSGLGIWPGRPDPWEEAAGVKELPRSPGRMKVHYAPRTRAYWVEPHLVGRFYLPGRGAWLVVGGHELPGAPKLEQRIDLATPQEASRSLYAALHDLDALGLDFIFIVPPPDQPEWEAVRDRLWRATRWEGRK